MTKKPIAIISNDWHIRKDNHTQILDLVQQKIDLAKQLKVDKLFILGDIFESRNEQPLGNLKVFEKMLDLFNENDLKAYIIPGNHDKVDYKLDHSYLDAYQYHPSIKLVQDSYYVPLDKYSLFILPFFDNEEWIKKCSNVIRECGPDVLLSHQAVQGSVNNDGSKVDSTITIDLLKPFKKVFLGHYHNEHKVGKNIFHLPSVCQNNYGENDNKGFTILYDDLSYKIHQTQFKKFRTIPIDITGMDKKRFDEVVSSSQDENINTRLVITGEQDQIKSLNLQSIKQKGLDVKVEQKEINTSIIEVEEGKIPEFNDTSILEEFKVFCEKNEYTDTKTGLKYIQQKLQING